MRPKYQGAVSVWIFPIPRSAGWQPTSTPARSRHRRSHPTLPSAGAQLRQADAQLTAGARTVLAALGRPRSNSTTIRTPFSENDRRGESDESPAHDDNIGLVHSAIVPPLRTVASDGYFDLKRPTRSPPIDTHSSLTPSSSVISSCSSCEKPNAT